MEPRVLNIIDFMKANLRRSLSLNEMAEIVNLSPSRLDHLFKAEIGITPMQYLKSLRIEKASQLLQTTFLTVKEIMAEVGIDDKSHFLRDFKKTHGLAPTEYRSSCLRAKAASQREIAKMAYK